MRRAQDGDQAAYRVVLRAVVPAVRAYARRRVFDEILVEDVIQDTLLTIHRLRHTYDPARPLLPWIAAITSARAVDALRRHGRSRRREVADEVALAAAVDMAALETLETAGADQTLGRLLGVLPERQRRVVEMVKLREMTLDAAADESRLSVGAVKSLLHRAYARLREHGMHSNG
ncbi:sigma-70 family RNA polymerase sigma factor [Sphingomonas quercus]|uniref:Sigma-70 family RNA polymerase sigma factor n=1 Tax=Sphingomonas quercus TaxID=2842451 RepID=A0ABS6BI22_9SPHN|nr:sigma-70 family RNA polymerase sigma factor [Sphingomonas quercus]MBU3077958.1 sigma-70 family RNA polymerase sigma factor [Sphingomonas quercus]